MLSQMIEVSIMSHNHVEKYNSYRDEIRKRKLELEVQISHIDLEQQDILHFLENEKCDAITMSKITKRLIALRKERREIKEEWTDVNRVWQHIHNKMQERTFTGHKYRTNIINEFVKEK